MMTIRIRRCKPGDRKAVLAAFRSNVPAYFPASKEGGLGSCLDEPDGRLFVAIDGEEVVGFGGDESRARVKAASRRSAPDQLLTSVDAPQ